MTVVTCRNCQEDFDADDGGCPGCGHPRIEPQGHPVGDVCADCGTQRIGAQGLQLRRGSPCLNCGSLDVRLPRREGQVVGDTWSAMAHKISEAGVDEQVDRALASLEAEGLSPATTHGRSAASRAPASLSTSDERTAA